MDQVGMDRHGMERLFVCPHCARVSPAPAGGGATVCAECGASSVLPARAELVEILDEPPEPDNDPARLAALRARTARPHVPGPSLVAVLGGDRILPGHEREAVLVWQSLRARASDGDVAAGEDLAALTVMLLELPEVPGLSDCGQMARALTESALDVSVLPRHRQEHLGRLCRSAAEEADAVRLRRLLAAMDPQPDDLESDTEYRVASALAAVLDDDSERVLRALGRDRASVPLVGRAAPAAILLRAHALERLGHHDEALRALRAYPLHGVFAKVAGQFAALRPAERASAAYAAEQARACVLEVARLAGPTPVMWMSGAAMVLSGGMFFAIGAFVAGAVGWSNAGAWTNGVIGALCAVPGLAVLAVAARKAVRAARIRRANRIPAAP